MFIYLILTYIKYIQLVLSYLFTYLHNSRHFYDVDDTLEDEEDVRMYAYRRCMRDFAFAFCVLRD